MVRLYCTLVELHKFRFQTSWKRVLTNRPRPPITVFDGAEPKNSDHPTVPVQAGLSHVPRYPPTFSLWHTLTVVHNLVNCMYSCSYWAALRRWCKEEGQSLGRLLSQVYHSIPLWRGSAMRPVMSMITVASQLLGGCLVPFTYDVKAEECLKPSKALLQNGHWNQ